MKRNLKLLYGILMASFISNCAISHININSAKASRTSRPVVVNNSSNEKTTSNTNENSKDNTSSDSNSSNTNTESNKDSSSSSNNSSSSNGNSSSSSSSGNSSSSNSSSNSTETTTLMKVLNSNKDLTIEEIAELALSASHSIGFIEEFKETFPELNPLRQITPIDNNLNNYLDVNNAEINTLNQILNKSTSSISPYADQNSCNLLLNEISITLAELKESIEEELPSTIFSLVPTITVFNDTFKILSEQYSNIVQSDYKNQITLNILLDELKPKLSSLLKSMQEFKVQLPDLIDTLNQLAKDLEDKDDDINVDIEIPDDTTDEEEIPSDEIDSENSDSENIDSETPNTDNDVNSGNTNSGNTSSETPKGEGDTTNEDVVSTDEMVYFGEDGQQLLYDPDEDKFYELNPEDPESEEFIEYTGEVISMTLEEYLQTELYFDPDGNELLYDIDTDSFLKYDEETGEYVPYEGEVTSMTLGDYLDLLEE